VSRPGPLGEYSGVSTPPSFLLTECATHSRRTLDTALLAGIQKELPTASFTVLSQAQTEAQVVAVLQSRIDIAQAVLTARTAFHAAVVASEEEYAATNAYVRSLRASIVAMYANSPTVSASFQLTARKPPTPLTPAEKVVAAAKRKATRVARHTMGKVQKSEVSGSLTEPIVVQLDGSTGEGTSKTSSASAPAAPAATPAAGSSTHS
jgi:hypothetical protein